MDPEAPSNLLADGFADLDEVSCPLRENMEWLHVFTEVVSLVKLAFKRHA